MNMNNSLKRAREETNEEYAKRSSKLYVPLHHSPSSTLEKSGSVLSGERREEQILTRKRGGSRKCPKDILVGSSLAKARETFLGFHTKVCNLKCGGHSTTTNNALKEKHPQAGRS